MTDVNQNANTIEDGTLPFEMPREQESPLQVTTTKTKRTTGMVSVRMTKEQHRVMLKTLSLIATSKTSLWRGTQKIYIARPDVEVLTDLYQNW